MSKQTPKSKARKELAKVSEASVESVPEIVEAPEKKILIKQKTPEEKQKAHREGIIKTIVSSILGIISGVVMFSQYGAGEDRIWYAILVIVIGITYYIQRILYPMIKIDTKEFKAKDWIFVEFIVVDFFLVTWTLLLN
ncbi:MULTISPECIES: hypothetical protein [unclassified Methanosarcina]|uniref:EMC6-like membrane protein n=1 Tax=unclassified Methanosarcina TaxID=2644672 RepID=UPI000615537C|nr:MULTISPECIES: hypothetical protein [unclassified Methanosarcina]AKB17505.1 hypothetical protein MSWHS_0642 [Methanosarcina sp. WWM596]AKB20894.1 hypothetical protein MSWH1_0623 [Methanosarcina sp. WH1]